MCIRDSIKTLNQILSKKKINEINSKNTGEEIKINVFKDNSENSSIHSKNQAPASVITFRRESKIDMCSMNSEENSNESSKRGHKKSGFINSRRFRQNFKSKKLNNKLKTKRQKIIYYLKSKISEIKLKFKMKKKTDHIDRNIYKSVSHQINKIEESESQQLKDILSLIHI